MFRALMLALIGGGAFAAVYVGTAPAPLPLPETPTKTASLPEPAPTDPPPVSFELRPAASDDFAPGGESLASPIRDVTPANMTALSPAEAAPAKADIPAASKESTIAAAEDSAHRERLFNPIVASAGELSIGEQTIRLAGIEAPAVDKRCGTESASWPCGRMARTALRRFIRGRAVECEVPEGAETISGPARCFIAGESVAGWLVAHGWAKSADDALMAAEEKARAARLGLWSDGWPGGQPAEVATGD